MGSRLVIEKAYAVHRTYHIAVAGVGKTCLLIRFSEDKFSPTYITTIGVDFKTKIIEVLGKRVKMQVRIERLTDAN